MKHMYTILLTCCDDSLMQLCQKREIVWTGCSTLSHNKFCGISVIDGVLKSSLSVTIDYNLLCIRVCAFYKSSLDIV